MNIVFSVVAVEENSVTEFLERYTPLEILNQGPVLGAIITACITLLVFILTKVWEVWLSYKSEVISKESSLEFFSKESTLKSIKNPEKNKIFFEGQVYLMDSLNVQNKVGEKKDDFMLIVNTGDNPMTNVEIEIRAEKNKVINTYTVHFLESKGHVYILRENPELIKSVKVKFESLSGIKYSYTNFHKDKKIIMWRKSWLYPKKRRKNINKKSINFFTVYK